MPIDPLGFTPSSTEGQLQAQISDLARRLGSLEAVRTSIQRGAVTANMVGTGAISTGSIAAGSVIAGHMTANSIQTFALAAEAVTAAKIAAGTITATQIAATTITGDKIAGQTIEAVNIKTGTITAEVIAAEAITADKIKALAVTTAKLDALAVTAEKINAGAITTDKLNALAVTTEKLAANSVTAVKIQVDSLAAISGTLGSINFSTGTGSTIRTSASGARVEMDSTGLRGYALNGTTKTFEINAGSGIASFTGVANVTSGSVIPTSTLTGVVPTANLPILGGGNMLPNTNFVNGITAPYTFAANATLVDAGGSNPTSPVPFTNKLVRFAHSGGAAEEYPNVTSTERIPVKPSTKYTVSLWIYSDSTPTPAMYGSISMFTWNSPTGGSMVGEVGTSWTQVGTAGSWKRISATVTTPATAVSMTPGNAFRGRLNTGQVVYAAGAQIEEGEIASAYTPKPGEIVAGSLQPSQLGFTIGGGNLLPNSSFEVNDANASWTPDGTWAPDTTEKWAGNSAAKLTYTAGASLGVRTTVRVPVKELQPYVLSAYFKAGSASMIGRQRRLLVQWHNSAGTLISTSDSSGSMGALTTDWFRGVYYVTAPAGAVTANVYARLSGMPGTSVAGEFFYLDALQFEQASIVTAYAPRPDEILPGTVGTNELSALAVTAAKIAANTITAAQIASDTITATQIAANAITVSELAADSVTTAKMTVNSINGDRISTNTLNADKIVSNSIDTLQLKAGAVTTNVLAAGAVTAQKITVAALDGTTGNLVPNSVGLTQIQPDSITSEKIVANSILASDLNVTNLSAITSNLGTVTAGTINGIDITGSTITGSTIRTSATAGHLELNASGLYTDERTDVARLKMSNAGLEAYDSTGANTSLMSPDGFLTYYGSLEAVGTTTTAWKGVRWRKNASSIDMGLLRSTLYEPTSGGSTAQTLTQLAGFLPNEINRENYGAVRILATNAPGQPSASSAFLDIVTRKPVTGAGKSSIGASAGIAYRTLINEKGQSDFAQVQNNQTFNWTSQNAGDLFVSNYLNGVGDGTTYAKLLLTVGGTAYAPSPGPTALYLYIDEVLQDAQNFLYFNSTGLHLPYTAKQYAVNVTTGVSHSYRVRRINSAGDVNDILYLGMTVLDGGGIINNN